ncbi:uncharacterized protein LOC122015624 [Zingiber officinale]|uniref:uncharacterized protein LOC122015624 n=1 Tax=Zingiber officinale TaxID=94328 RepID=UPI001C4D725A|nr:uncharacterized protein LOC122015624 [Zingiber officinale]
MENRRRGDGRLGMIVNIATDVGGLALVTMGLGHRDRGLNTSSIIQPINYSKTMTTSREREDYSLAAEFLEEHTELGDNGRRRVKLQFWWLEIFAGAAILGNLFLSAEQNLEKENLLFCVPDDIKKEIRESLDKIRASKSKQTELLREIGEGPQSMSTQLSKVGSVGGNSIGCSGSGESKGKGTLHGFISSEPRQTTLNSTYKKDLLVDVKRRIGRFIYSAALPFNVVNDPYWLPMVDGIAEYGRGFKPPSMHELRTWILKAEVDGINLIYEEHKKAWKKYGCTIMSDGWTDGKNRSLINFLVNSPAGTFFLKSIDASDSIKNGELIFKYLNDVVDEVGEENVIQIVTDNASNYIKAGKKIMETRHRIWWTPCAAHCIALI